MMTRKLTLLGSCLYSLTLLACGSDSSSTEPVGPTSSAGTPAPTAAGGGATEQAGAAAPAQQAPSSNTASTNQAAAAPTPAPAANTPAPNAPTANAPSQSAGTAPSTAIDFNSDIRGKCAIKTNFPDDQACIPAPPAGEGMQIHVGPKNYDDAEEVAKFIMHPGEESSECFFAITPNDQKIYYQSAVLSGRAGTHHIINSMYEGDGSLEAPSGAGPCSDGATGGSKQIGSAPGASKPYMPRLAVAPEYANVGKSMPAHAKIQSDMHYYNFTDKDIIREYWLNVYFVPAEKITEESKQIAALGGFGWNQNPIQPKTDQVFSYSCPVKGDGYIMQLLGHYHAHGKRFTATITRAAGGTDKVFEMFDYMEPAQFDYNSISMNPVFAEGSAGAVSGRLQVFNGDVVNWECHIVNDSDVALRYVNEVKTGEMCNLWGQSLGIEAISCYKP